MNRTTKPKSGLLQIIREQRAIVRSVRQSRRRDWTQPQPTIGIVPDAEPDADARTVTLAPFTNLNGTWAQIEARMRAYGYISRGFHMVRYNTGRQELVNGAVKRDWADAQTIKAPKIEVVGSVTAEQIPAADNVGEQLTQVHTEHGEAVDEAKLAKLAAKRERDAKAKRDKRAALKAEGQKTD